jgi:hypothetical protein
LRRKKWRSEVEQGFKVAKTDDANGLDVWHLAREESAGEVVATLLRDESGSGLAIEAMLPSGRIVRFTEPARGRPALAALQFRLLAECIQLEDQIEAIQAAQRLLESIASLPDADAV